MDDIRRMLDRLPELSDADLEALESSIVSEFGEIEAREITRESVSEMTFLADSVESVRSERAKREQEKAQLAAEASEAAARVTEQSPNASADDEAEAEVEVDEAGDEEKKSPPAQFAAEEVVEGAVEVEATTAGGLVADEVLEQMIGEVVADTVAATDLDDAAEAAVVEPQAEAVEPLVEAEAAVVEVAAEAAVAEEPTVVEVEAVAVEPSVAEYAEEPVVVEESIPAAEAAAAEVPEVAVPEVAAEEASELGTAEVASSEQEPVVEQQTAAVEDVAALSDNSEDVEAQMSDTAAGPETFSAPADRLPNVRETKSVTPIALVAGGDIPGITAGSALSGASGLAEAMSLRLHTLRRASGGHGDQVVVASLIAQFPEDRTLRGNELDSNSDKIKSITSPTAVVASGGWCAPLPVNYDIFDIGGSTATPLKDALATFNADRGGVRYIVPPVLGDYQGAIGIWTNEDDIAAAPPATSPRKPCLTVQCAQETEVYLDAVTMCLCFGNLMTRAFPELIDRHNQLALIEAARFAELYILTKIKELSTAVTLPAVLGAVRDILISVERAATAYRNQYRLDPALPLRFVAPQWVHAMLRSDLTAQLPGDGMETTFNVSNATIDNFFKERNINPVWTLEGLGDQPTVTDYPDTVEWALFSEGTFTLLDGGTLDIGLVRDMELVSTNDYCMFTEQFLAVAKTGLDGLWITQSLNVNGGSAGTLDVAAVDY